MAHHIYFPGLGIDFGEINPVAFSLFGRDIMWYGIIIAVGFMLAAFYAARRAHQFGLESDNIFDLIIVAAPTAIVFARAYYVIFKFSEYKDDILSIFKIWEGGIAVYGSIIGAAVALVIFCRAARIDTWAMLDIGSLGMLIGQAVGRWGNFINAEAYGTATSLPWAMFIETRTYSANVYGVHPTFLYESIWNALGFVVLHVYSKKCRGNRHGSIFALYLIWYGVGRAFIEGLRVDSLYLFGTGIRVSQLVAVITVFIGAFIFIKRRDNIDNHA